MADANGHLVERAQHVGQRLASRLSWLGPLLVRVSVGVVFVGTGWGKLHSLEKVTAFFSSLGIPAPGANAAVVATLEFIGGLALIAGLGARVAAAPLVGVMTVAIITAKREDLSGVADLLSLDEFLYLSVFVWIILAGPGKASLDYLVARWWRARHAKSTTGSGDPVRA